VVQQKVAQPNDVDDKEDERDDVCARVNVLNELGPVFQNDEGKEESTREKTARVGGSRVVQPGAVDFATMAKKDGKNGSEDEGEDDPCCGHGPWKVGRDSHWLARSTLNPKPRRLSPTGQASERKRVWFVKI